MVVVVVVVRVVVVVLSAGSAGSAVVVVVVVVVGALVAVVVVVGIAVVVVVAVAAMVVVVVVGIVVLVGMAVVVVVVVVVGAEIAVVVVVVVGIVVVVLGMMVVVVDVAGVLGVGEMSNRASPGPLLFLKCTTTVCFPAVSRGVAHTSIVGLVPHFSRIWRPSTQIRIESSLLVVNRVTPAAKVNSAVHEALKLVDVLRPGGVKPGVYLSSRLGSQTVVTGGPVTVVVLKNCTSHAPGLQEITAAPPSTSGIGVGIGALTGPVANAGVKASAARDEPLFGR